MWTQKVGTIAKERTHAITLMISFKILKVVVHLIVQMSSTALAHTVLILLGYVSSKANVSCRTYFSFYQVHFVATTNFFVLFFFFFPHYSQANLKELVEVTIHTVDQNVTI